MNKYVRYTLPGLLFLALLLAGCVKDGTSTDALNDGKQELRLSLSTYAASDDPNLTPDLDAPVDETAIYSVFVYIFTDKGVLENPGKVEVAPASGSWTFAEGVLPATWRVTPGPKRIYVVANPPASLRYNGGMPTAQPLSESEILNKYAAEGDFWNDLTAGEGLPMTGKTDVTVSSTANTVPVKLARRHARIDLILKKGTGFNQKVSISGVALTRENHRLPLFTHLQSREDSEQSIFESRELDDGADNYICSFYTAPRKGSVYDNEPLCITLFGTIDDVGMGEYGAGIPIYLNKGALNGGTANEDSDPIDIEGNTVYKVSATITPRKVTVDLQVADWFLWNSENLDDGIYGAALGIDSVLLINAGSNTQIPVTFASEELYAGLSQKAVDDGFYFGHQPGFVPIYVHLPGSGTSLPCKGELIIRGPSEYVYDAENHYVTIVTGNIRRKVPIKQKVESRLSVSDIVFEHGGGTTKYEVESRGVLTNGTAIPLSWTAEWVEDDGSGGYRPIATPSWVSYFTVAAPGDAAAPKEYSGKATAQPYSAIGYPHNLALQNAPEVSSYDLTTSGGTTAMNSANCYIVNAPGTYQFQPVYGNAIKNGLRNTAAYAPGGSATNRLTAFVDHLGNSLTNPYMINHLGDAGIKDAVLLWQDEPGLVTNVRLNANKRLLLFDVPRATIKQGNAVVALRDPQNRIIWSWHIWVTDYKLGDDLKRMTNNQDVAYDFMPVNIGWCDGGTEIYDGRSAKMRFTQTDTGLTQIVTVIQKAGTKTEPGNNPHFQWGRKDPFPAIITGTKDKDTYFGSGYAFTKNATAVTVDQAIQTPYVLYTPSASSYANWCSANYLNLWSANNTGTNKNDNAVVKTIYDPSPAGYCLPASNAFSGITCDGSYVSLAIKKINTVYPILGDVKTYSGWEFYCNKMLGEGTWDPSGGSIFFPLSGYRTSNGSAMGFKNDSKAWTAGPGSAGAYEMNSNVSSADPAAQCDRTWSIPVRPCKEK